MKIGVFGTGMVGQSIAGKLVALGHEVMLGSRSATHEKALAWVAAAGKGASNGTFADAAAHGELLFHCGSGQAALEILALVSPADLDGKILVDVTNPLDFSRGMPPSLSTGGGTDSIAEAIQRTYPKLDVVKSLNTVNADVMVNPALAGREHDVFVSGNSVDAKAQVTRLLESFGWSRVIDLGDVTTARGAEAYVLFWLRLWGATKDAKFNIRLVRPGD